MILTDHQLMNSIETIISTVEKKVIYTEFQCRAQVANLQIISNSIRMGGQKKLW